MLHRMSASIRMLGPLAVALVTSVHVTSPASGLLAQTAAPDSGMFIIRHAGDTVATERFVRTATTLNGTLAIRGGKGSLEGYEAVVAPDASVAMIEVTVRQVKDRAGESSTPSGRPNGRVVQRARVIFKEDSAAVDDVGSRGLQTRVFGTERGAVPYLNLSFALLEQAVRRARAVSPEASRVAFFNLGGGQTLDAKVARVGADSVTLALGNVEFRLRVDSAGRVLGGAIPSQQLVADRVGGS
jgi:hypothetical protein